MNTLKPITPDEIPAAKAAFIPDFVIRVVNKLLTENYSDGVSRVNQNDIIIDMHINGDSGLTYDTYDQFRSLIFSNNYLDFEDIYRAAGWVVTYDQPAYYEAYDATFIFERK